MPQKRLQLLVMLGVVLMCPIAMVLPDDNARDLRLVPYPKQVEIQPGTFQLPQKVILQLPAGVSAPIAAQLTAELQRAGVTDVVVKTNESRANVMALVLAADMPGTPPIDFGTDPGDEMYYLAVTPAYIRCDGIDAAGLFHGVQTLCQLIRANRVENRLPCLEIRDWPSLRWRCFQDDLTRGPSSTLDTLRQHVDLGAELKMNLFTYYMEYQYRVPEASGDWTARRIAAAGGTRANWSSTPRRGTWTFWGTSSRSGTGAWILKHPEFESLRETRGCAVSRRTRRRYQLLDDMYSEVCPLLPFPMFNVCCDETYGLGNGPSKALADQIGVGGVYVRHIRRVHDLLQGEVQQAHDDVGRHHSAASRQAGSDSQGHRHVDVGIPRRRRVSRIRSCRSRRPATTSLSVRASTTGAAFCPTSA